MHEKGPRRVRGAIQPGTKAFQQEEEMGRKDSGELRPQGQGTQLTSPGQHGTTTASHVRKKGIHVRKKGMWLLGQNTCL